MVEEKMHIFMYAYSTEEVNNNDYKTRLYLDACIPYFSNLN